MVFFKKKQKVDFDALFKDKYKSINQLLTQANNELDFILKESLYDLIIKEYDELLSLIDQGASFDKDHFISLREHAYKQYQQIKDINKG